MAKDLFSKQAAVYAKYRPGYPEALTKEGYSPVEALIKELDAFWKEDELKEIAFPLFLKLGRIKQYG